MITYLFYILDNLFTAEFDKYCVKIKLYDPRKVAGKTYPQNLQFITMNE